MHKICITFIYSNIYKIDSLFFFRKMADESMGVLRIRKSLHEKAKKLADENNLTLTFFAEKAIEEHIEKVKYNILFLMKEIEKYPLLSVYKEFIKKEFFDAPNNIIKDIYKTLNETTTFNRFPFEESLIKKFIKDNMRGVLIITTNDSPEMGVKVNKIVDLITHSGLKNLDIRFVLRRNESIKENPEILLFSSRVKGDEKSEKI